MELSGREGKVNENEVRSGRGTRSGLRGGRNGRCV